MKSMKEYWKDILIAAAIAGGLYSLIPIHTAICAGILLVFIYKKWEPKTEKSEVEKMLIEADGVIVEQEEVIREYEQIFESLETSLPCNCGGNTFQGLFAPGVENIVECQKCGANYKVMVSFDSILITDPMDLDKTTEEIDKKIQKL